MEKYRPIISGFVDFLQFHASGEPIYIFEGHLQSGFDLLVPVAARYQFTNESVMTEIETALRKNKYFFDVENSSGFYWPNTNMFSSPCSLEHENGKIYTIKEKYRKQWR